MYSFREYLRPVFDYYNQWLNGFETSDLLQFKGQKGAGNNYVSKVFRGQMHEIYSKYHHITDSITDPSAFGFIKDNFIRLFLLNAVERLIVAYQVTHIDPERSPGRPSTYSFLFTEIMNDGAFRGTLKGVSMSLVQAACVLWPAIYVANTQKNGMKGFVGTYLLMDTILHPIDTIKTQMYGNTSSPIGLRDAIAKVRFFKLSAGLGNKIIFNIPFSAALYSTTQNDSNSWAYWLATAICYPLLVKKSIKQISPHVINYHLLTFRGLIPFFLLNIGMSWKMYALYSEQKVQEVLYEAQETSIKKMGKI